MNVVARSRSYAYIYKGFCAAKKVCSTCPLCNLKEATKASQRMGELPTDRLLPYVPFLGSKEHFSGFTEDDLASLQSRWM